ncbi:MAG: VCBS repeat-containing protein, partial [Chloroflexota bacterium]|nr:VCBS repeat-containing protein [Chloroflexota bacterium]
MTRPIRLLALLAVVLISCTATTPQPSPSTTTAEPTVAATATPKPIVPVKARTATAVGNNVVVAGDFEGTKKTQVATISDPVADLTLRIALRGKTADAAETVWFKSDANFLAMRRAKFAVADVDGDGKDDLVALYDSGANSSKLYVWKSTGSAFTFANVWWSGPEYMWARARNIVSGKFGGTNKDTLLVTYQDDGARMRIHAFESDGKAIALTATVFDSGPGKFDLAKAKVAVGHFTRATAPDQLALFYQTTAKPHLFLFDAGSKGMTVTPDVFVADADYDLSRASLAAADVNGDGRDDLVSLYTDADGSAKLNVFDAAASFLPVNGWNGTALAAGALCPRTGSLVLGDWDFDGKADALALAPATAGLRANVLSGSGASFT